jgi:endonuclease/exonuclease/phosphatase family metal-dependent hydrolase
MATRPQRNPSLSVLVLLLVAVLLFIYLYRESQTRRPETEAGEPGTYLFCFWNVENLFDDRLDHRTGPGDPEYDTWFARDPASREQKLDHLCRALLELNDGKGPDILAVAEVETERAAELLGEALNARLADKSLHYAAPLMKEVSSGRHIAPAVLTRLPVERDRTQLLGGKRLRIVETHLRVNGRPLVLIASHWTSRISDKTGDGRRKYADQIYGRYRAMFLSNPAVDLVVCGDFNDDPDDPSVTESLHARGNRAAVLASHGETPLLYNLFADRDARQYGTLYYKRWHIFDQIIVSPGMLDDQGWTCETDTVAVVNTIHRPNDRLRRPWSFGIESEKNDRGSSDHFPVTVRLRVDGGRDAP